MKQGFTSDVKMLSDLKHIFTAATHKQVLCSHGLYFCIYCILYCAFSALQIQCFLCLSLWNPQFI